MQAKDVMTPHLKCIGPNTSLALAARRMRDDNVGCLIVAEGDQLVGIVTDRDLVVRAMADGRDGNAMPVRDVMSAEVLFCYADQPVEEAAQIMLDNQVRRLAVLERASSRPLGIVSFHRLSGGEAPRTRPREVTFYREVVDSSGHQHEVPLATVRVTGRKKKEEVEEVAVRKFEKEHKVSDWSQLANKYEIRGEE